MKVISSHPVCPSLCYELWTTKHLLAPSKNHFGFPSSLFFFLMNSPSLRGSKTEGQHQHQGEIIYLLLKKILGLAGHSSGCPSLPGCFHLTCHPLSTLPWVSLTWRQFWSSALPPLPSFLLPSHHTLLSQGVFGRMGRNYSKNRIFTSPTVACHLVPSWFAGGFELPRLATQEATANRASMAELSGTAEFGMTGRDITFLHCGALKAGFLSCKILEIVVDISLGGMKWVSRPA